VDHIKIPLKKISRLCTFKSLIGGIASLLKVWGVKAWYLGWRRRGTWAGVCEEEEEGVEDGGALLLLVLLEAEETGRLLPAKAEHSSITRFLNSLNLLAWIRINLHAGPNRDREYYANEDREPNP